VKRSRVLACSWARARWRGLAFQGVLIALALALALVLPGWAAALIVSSVLLLAGAVLGLLGKRRLAAKLSLATTRQNVEEDVTWTKSHLSSTDR
jgi:Na+-transporting NADH:ubiquinone oxidoreductase subunit NqrB